MQQQALLSEAYLGNSNSLNRTGCEDRKAGCLFFFFFTFPSSRMQTLFCWPVNGEKRNRTPAGFKQVFLSSVLCCRGPVMPAGPVWN